MSEPVELPRETGRVFDEGGWCIRCGAKRDTPHKPGFGCIDFSALQTVVDQLKANTYEPPGMLDFAKVAAEIITATAASGPLDRLDLERLLVSVWNARGAADLTALDDSHDKYTDDNRDNYERGIARLDR